MAPPADTSHASKLKYYSYGAAVWVILGLVLLASMTNRIPTTYIVLNLAACGAYVALAMWGRKQPITAGGFTALLFAGIMGVNATYGATSGLLVAGAFLGLLLNTLYKAVQERQQVPASAPAPASAELPATQMFRMEP